MAKAKDGLRQPNNDVKSPVIQLQGINRFLLWLIFKCLGYLPLRICPRVLQSSSYSAIIKNNFPLYPLELLLYLHVTLNSWTTLISDMLYSEHLCLESTNTVPYVCFV